MKKVIAFLFLLTVFFVLASCKKASFTINFIVDGAVYASIDTGGNETIQMPQNPTKEGYEFDGWYWDKDTWKKQFTARSLLDTPLSSNMEVYAHFVDESSLKGTDMDVKDSLKMDVPGVGDVFYLEVPNNQVVLKFNDYVEVNPSSSWIISTDIGGNNTITSKTVELSLGDNPLYYVYVTDANDKHETYVILVHRNYIFTVTFNTAGGSSCSSVEVEEGHYLTKIPESTMKGYEFAGWNYDFKNNPIKSNVAATAKWNKIMYNIQLDANGGSCNSSSIKVGYGDNYDLPTPTKKGHTFDGWYSEEGTKYYAGIWREEKDITLCARWTVNTYNIAYKLDGGTIGNAPSWYTYGDTVSIPNPTKDGYEFSGWLVGGSLKSKDYSITSDTYGDLELFAKYEAKKYTISFDADGGNCSASSMEVLFNSAYKLPIPTKKGYSFDGWYNGTTKITDGTWNRTSSLDLKAKWLLTNYKIDYVMNGGTNDSSNPTTFTLETETITIIDPTRVGYTFTGWTTSTNSTPVKNYSIVKGTVDNQKLTANWAANKYTITYDVNGGSELQSATQEVTYGENITLVTPTRTGYTFKGWYNVDSKFESGLWNYSDNINLKAKWEITTFNINYTLNGGTNNNSNVYSYNYESEDIIIKAPEKNGYEFVGWKVNGSEESVVEFTIEHNSINDIELDAVFTPNKYNLTLDVNGGADLANSKLTIEFDSDYTLEIPTRTGYDFDGWYKDTSKVENGKWNYAEDITLKAKWILVNYTITYELDGGKNNGYNPSKYNYEYEEITIYEPTKTGYTFIGWTSDEINTPTKEIVIEHNSTGNKSFEANWQVNKYHIYYDVNGGDDLAETDVIVEYGATYTLFTPTRTGYEFDGWYNESVKFQEGKWQQLDDVSLVAKWNVIWYSISYELDGGSSDNVAMYNYDTETFSLSEPIKKGYTFLGWTNDNIFVPKKQITIQNHSQGDLTYSANWEVNEYTITLNCNGGDNIDNSEFSIVYGTTYELPIPTREDYVFLGWSYNGEKVPLSGEWNIDENVEVKAKWAYGFFENGINYCYLGMYPQSVVTDKSTIDALNEILEPELNGWYLYDGNYYAKQVASISYYESYYANNYVFSNGQIINNGSSYWFKCEPIKWILLENDNGQLILLCNSVLDSQCYYHDNSGRYIDDVYVYASNYEYSDIRVWLNDEFYNKAFGTEKSIIRKVNVDNSVATIFTNNTDLMKGVCSDTQDYVFLPSYQDYASNYGLTNESRMIHSTDYAICRGTVYNARTLQGYAMYWTRSPYGDNRVEYVNIDGHMSRIGVNVEMTTNTPQIGVRPAIVLDLSI